MLDINLKDKYLNDFYPALESIFTREGLAVNHDVIKIQFDLYFLNCSTVKDLNNYVKSSILRYAVSRNNSCDRKSTTDLVRLLYKRTPLGYYSKTEICSILDIAPMTIAYRLENLNENQIIREYEDYFKDKAIYKRTKKMPFLKTSELKLLNDMLNNPGISIGELAKLNKIKEETIGTMKYRIDKRLEENQELFKLMPYFINDFNALYQRHKSMSSLKHLDVLKELYNRNNMGYSTEAELAKKYGVSRNTIGNWIKVINSSDESIIIGEYPTYLEDKNIYDKAKEIGFFNRIQLIVLKEDVTSLVEKSDEALAKKYNLELKNVRYLRKTIKRKLKDEEIVKMIPYFIKDYSYYKERKELFKSLKERSKKLHFDNKDLEKIFLTSEQELFKEKIGSTNHHVKLFKGIEVLRRRQPKLYFKTNLDEKIAITLSTDFTDYAFTKEEISSIMKIKEDDVLTLTKKFKGPKPVYQPIKK